MAALLLISLFFCLALIVLGLSQVSFVRKVHPIGLFGSAAIQERRVLLIILGSAFLFLFMALAIGSIFDPTLVFGVGDTIGPPFNWLLRAFVYGLAFVVSPVVWLFQMFFHLFSPAKNLPVQIPLCRSKLPQHCSIVTPRHANTSGQHLPTPNIHLTNAANSWVSVLLIVLAAAQVVSTEA